MLLKINSKNSQKSRKEVEQLNRLRTANTLTLSIMLKACAIIATMSMDETGWRPSASTNTTLITPRECVTVVTTLKIPKPFENHKKSRN